MTELTLTMLFITISEPNWCTIDLQFDESGNEDYLSNQIFADDGIPTAWLTGLIRRFASQERCCPNCMFQDGGMDNCGRCGAHVNFRDKRIKVVLGRECYEQTDLKTYCNVQIYSINKKIEQIMRSNHDYDHKKVELLERSKDKFRRVLNGSLPDFIYHDNHIKLELKPILKLCIIDLGVLVIGTDGEPITKEMLVAWGVKTE